MEKLPLKKKQLSITANYLADEAAYCVINCELGLKSGDLSLLPGCRGRRRASSESTRRCSDSQCSQAENPQLPQPRQHTPRSQPEPKPILTTRVHQCHTGTPSESQEAVLHTAKALPQTNPAFKF